tara:strand:- start:1023 stop:1265 length:243 start_codon:yes stop_codon:yes gene_type:complete
VFKFISQSLNLNRIDQVPERGKSKVFVVFMQKLLCLEPLLQVELNVRSYSFVFHLTSVPRASPIEIPFERNFNVVNLAWR